MADSHTRSEHRQEHNNMKNLIYLLLVIPLVQGHAGTERHSIEDYIPDLDEAFQDIEEGLEEGFDKLSEAMQCKSLGEECHGLPWASCCGDTVCYRDIQWNPFSAGSCVECVAQGEACQLDSHCCNSENGAFICDRDMIMAIEVSGRCQPPRRAGDVCHRDEMCESGHCDKTVWWKLYGKCT